MSGVPGLKKPPSEKDKLLDGQSSSNNASVSKQISDDSLSDDVKDEKGSTLIIAFFLMLFFQLGNRIFGKLETYPMYNYPMFLNLMSTAIYVPLSFVYIIPAARFTNNITKEQIAIPKVKFGVMGGLDSIACIMQVFAVNYISNASIIVLVQQSAIPISMVISKIFLKARYTIAQYSGAFIVLLGISVVLIPTVMKKPDESTDATANKVNEVFWLAVLAFSCIPMCMSSVYKEKALGEVDIDVIYLNGWVSVFQTLMSVPICFPSASLINMPYSEIMPNMYGGLLCWFGINTVTDSNGLQPIDDCRMGPYFVSAFFFFNVAYNLLIIIILKHGSANVLWLCSTVIVPLSNVAFSLKFMPGHKDLNMFDLTGLCVIMTGLVVYRFTAQLRTLYEHIFGTLTEEEVVAEKVARKIGKKTERKQLKFVGLNQVEALNTFVDIRVSHAQKAQLFRSPQQIRGSLLMRLGIPPSPYISLGPKGRLADIQRSPAMLGARRQMNSSGSADKLAFQYSPVVTGGRKPTVDIAGYPAINPGLEKRSSFV
mmetsp:Transcript_34580/g.35256  ORF Transcript_34580/g.35256 Transcript_34580/m.35256 type:complete len:540 (-) Transcript_34580:267-1886(-)|eukprot:CAMPEP_0182429040 /NCGR_PEP_ID=MMETSP1167-20130531/25468_1 /TAXON_ID=2988 /ORGANISM="Mallomonas Sp, Strain CCMP3275" /LENGTH=539 /DNA_ID=CAMNT_0024612339 /DNA_START=132 /DNA_END=1751 /DNA_ORIENTATION=+